MLSRIVLFATATLALSSSAAAGERMAVGATVVSPCDIRSSGAEGNSRDTANHADILCANELIGHREEKYYIETNKIPGNQLSPTTIYKSNEKELRKFFIREIIF